MRTGRPDAVFLLLLAAVLPLLISANHRDHLYLVPDVPADLTGATFLPWQVIRAGEGLYSPVLELPAGTSIDALHRMDNGHWLISLESTEATRYLAALAANIIEYVDSDSYVTRFDGAAAGIPPGVDVDAVFLDGGDAGDLVMSFDVPATVAGQTFEPADLVRFDGSSFSLYFDASAAAPPIPPSVNVTGADRRGGLTLLTFDVPVTIGGGTFLPGQIVSWDGAGFASFHGDASWPAGARVDAVALLARPGRVPPTLEVTHSAARGKLITLSWSASCSAGAEDYAIYEGTIGQWYSHTAYDCSDDGGDLREELATSPGDRYYLVVPLNASDEGSYGLTSSLLERPRGTTTCAALQAVSACP